MITVLFFAHLREQLGAREVKIDETALTVGELKQRLQAQYEQLDTKSVMIAVNEEFAADDEVVQAGDTVAFIPPVSGG